MPDKELKDFFLWLKEQIEEKVIIVYPSNFN